MNQYVKFGAAVLLMLAWGGLVLLGKVPAADYVTAIRDLLLALGVFGAISKGA